MRRNRDTAKANFEKGLAMLAELGVSADKLPKYTPGENPQQKETDQQQIDAVLLSLHKPHAIKIKKCSYCNEKFGTTYCAVGYCSHDCRIKALAESGIIIDPIKNIWPETFEAPLVIRPHLLAKMKNWAEAILSQMETLQTRTQLELTESEDLFSDDENVASSVEVLEVPQVQTEEQVHEAPTNPHSEPPTLILTDFVFSD